VRGRADVEAVSDPSAAIVVCTYGLLTKDAPAAAALGGRGFGVVVVDESHALKTRGSQRGLALAPVLAAAARLVLLSGTPALNRPAELYPQLAPSAAGARLPRATAARAAAALAGRPTARRISTSCASGSSRR
jgi:superfamily II helicase